MIFLTGGVAEYTPMFSIWCYDKFPNVKKLCRISLFNGFTDIDDRCRRRSMPMTNRAVLGTMFERSKFAINIWNAALKVNNITVSHSLWHCTRDFTGQDLHSRFFEDSRARTSHSKFESQTIRRTRSQVKYSFYKSLGLIKIKLQFKIKKWNNLW